MRSSVYEGMWLRALATSVCVQMFLIKLIVSSGWLMNRSSVAVLGTTGALSSGQWKETYISKILRLFSLKNGDHLISFSAGRVSISSVGYSPAGWASSLVVSCTSACFSEGTEWEGS